MYSGHLLTEEQSDLRGVELGDEYFAELDFVQCMKKATDGSAYNSESESVSENVNEDFDNKNEVVKRKKKLIKQESNSKLNTSYQRPKSHVTMPNKTRNSIEGEQEIEYVFLSNFEFWPSFTKQI